MSTSLYRTGSLALVAFAAACSAAATSGNTGSSGEAVSGTCATAVVVDRSLFVASVDNHGNPNAFGVAALKDFSFKTVMDQIVATGAKGSKLTSLELFDQMLDTLNKAPGDTDGPHCTGKINGFDVDCPRPEGALAATNPFTGEDGGGGGGGGDGGMGDGGGPPPPPDGDAGESDGGSGSADAVAPPPKMGGEVQESDSQPAPDQMIPVALVNRFDLAPSNGANCGEFRIVFAIPSPVFPVARFLMIFEATLPNPAPKQGLAACLPVAQFWDDLSASGLTQDEFVSKLKTFYFDGIPGLTGNPAFAPIIQAQNYGIGGEANTNTGQIRVNMLSTEEWQLREFTLSQVCSGTPSVCKLTANNTLVKNNPFGALFLKGGNATFQKELISQVKSLAADTIPLISMTTPDVDNAGQSSEQDDTNDYACQAGLGSAAGSFCSPSNPKNTSLSDAIQTELTKLGSKLTPEDIVQRATTQSCAGCHQLSPGTTLGGGLTWPASEVFTQVNEQGLQSVALTQHFLPFRSTVLTTFIDKHCPGSTPEADGDGTTTIGGQASGSAN